jgi:hypothetical protein
MYGCSEHSKTHPNQIQTYQLIYKQSNITYLSNILYYSYCIISKHNKVKEPNQPIRLLARKAMSAEPSPRSFRLSTYRTSETTQSGQPPVDPASAERRGTYALNMHKAPPPTGQRGLTGRRLTVEPNTFLRAQPQFSEEPQAEPAKPVIPAKPTTAQPEIIPTKPSAQSPREPSPTPITTTDEPIPHQPEAVKPALADKPIVLDTPVVPVVPDKPPIPEKPIEKPPIPEKPTDRHSIYDKPLIYDKPTDKPTETQPRTIELAKPMPLPSALPPVSETPTKPPNLTPIATNVQPTPTINTNTNTNQQQQPAANQAAGYQPLHMAGKPLPYAPSSLKAQQPLSAKPAARRSWFQRVGERIFGGRSEEGEYDESLVSTPFNVQHNIHVDFDSSTGFSGLPQDWEALLLSSNISKEEVIMNSEDVLSCLETHSKFIGAGTKGVRNAPQPPPSFQPSELPSERQVGLAELVSRENPLDLFTNMKKIGEGYYLSLLVTSLPPPPCYLSLLVTSLPPPPCYLSPSPSLLPLSLPLLVTSLPHSLPPLPSLSLISCMILPFSMRDGWMEGGWWGGGGKQSKRLSKGQGGRRSVCGDGRANGRQSGRKEVGADCRQRQKPRKRNTYYARFHPRQHHALLWQLRRRRQTLGGNGIYGRRLPDRNPRTAPFLSHV